jgi:hypothetical protein
VKPRPEPGVSYGAFPTGEYRAARSLEAVRSLAKAWGITEARSADLLADPAAYVVEWRSRLTDPVLARRQLERRYADPWLLAPP